MFCSICVRTEFYYTLLLLGTCNTGQDKHTLYSNQSPNCRSTKDNVSTLIIMAKDKHASNNSHNLLKNIACCTKHLFFS